MNVFQQKFVASKWSDLMINKDAASRACLNFITIHSVISLVPARSGSTKAGLKSESGMVDTGPGGVLLATGETDLEAHRRRRGRSSWLRYTDRHGTCSI